MLPRVNGHQFGTGEIHTKHPPSGVADPEATRFDTTNGGRSNDQDALRLGKVKNLPSVAFWNALSDQGNTPDLGVFQDLEGR